MITLKTLPVSTKQEVFDQVARHLLKQGEQSVNGQGHCKYRHENKKCAAGCLIGDDEHNLGMEGQTWAKLTSYGDCPCEHADLIGRLQKIHDHFSVENWNQRLKELAMDENLNWNL